MFYFCIYFVTSCYFYLYVSFYSSDLRLSNGLINWDAVQKKINVLEQENLSLKVEVCFNVKLIYLSLRVEVCFNVNITRMHSSRMPTGRSLTVCCRLLPGGGVCLVPGGVLPDGGVLPGPGGSAWSQGGFCLVRAGVSAWSQGGVCLVPGGGSLETPPVNRITDTCKNITLATTSLRPVMNLSLNVEVHLSVNIMNFGLKVEVHLNVNILIINFKEAVYLHVNIVNLSLQLYYLLFHENSCLWRNCQK